MSTLSNEFEAVFSYDWLPAELLDIYEPIECLADNCGCATLLMTERVSERKCIAKCYDKAQNSQHIDEGVILAKLSHRGLPKFLGQYENETTLCVVREYIDGVTLDRLVEQQFFSPDEAAALCLQICEILQYLHRPDIAIVHRDIKPQNIVIDEENNAYLIDFGISRIIKNEQNRDTIIAVSVNFAPPEQFGFLQTDARADIYSLGVVLYYAMTGDSCIENLHTLKCDHEMLQIIKKCTAFDPDNRYRSIKQLRRAIVNRSRRAVRIICRITAAVAAAAAFFAAFIFIVNSSEIFHSFELSKNYEMPATKNGAFFEQQENRNLLNYYYSEQQTEYCGHLYQVFDIEFNNYEEMALYCESLGGHLATLTTPEENQFAYNLMIDSGHMRAEFGLYKQPDGKWVWINGEDFEYSNWYQGEPNNSGGREYCGMFYYDHFRNDQWNDGDYFETSVFICEWDYPAMNSSNV